MSVLRSRYRCLDGLPRALFVPIVTHLHGDLEDRARSLVVLRSALLDGGVPSALSWPNPELSGALIEALRGSGIVSLCRGEPDLVDQVLSTILDAVTGAERLCFSASGHFAGLALAEHRRRQEVWQACSGSGCGGSAGSATARRYDEETCAEVRAEARRIAVDVAAAKIRAELSSWCERADAIKQLRELVVCLAPRRGFSLSRGLLRALAVRSTTAAYDLVRHLQRLHDLVLYLGRLRNPADASADTIFERIAGPMRRELPRPEVRTDPDIGPELRDLERSGDFSRMLPSEAAHLMHPTLARAWHARRAENALLVYRAERDARVQRMREESVDDGPDLEARRRVSGPVIVCLDTSGSMEGSRGALAKAIILHLTMTAHDEGRSVYVYAFGGPGDVVEHELTFDGEGVEALLSFLILDFSGGTDVSEPLRRALQRHDDAKWSRADLLLVSDGQFAVPREVVSAIRQRRTETDLRVHGLLVGNESSSAMAHLCSPLHRFREWVLAESS